MKVPTWVVGLGVGLVVVLLAAVLSLGVVASRDGANLSNPSRMMRMEGSGEMHQMLEQHQEMLDRMRSDASPQMQQMMRDDPMSDMMMSGEMIRLMEEHQAEVDTMLGRR